MSSCDGVECSECGASSECVIEDCIENGGDKSTCCFCKVQAGDMEFDKACDECKTELEELG